MPGVQSHEEGAQSLLTKQPGGKIKVRKARGESREVTAGSTRAARTKCRNTSSSCTAAPSRLPSIDTAGGTVAPVCQEILCAKGNTEQHLCVTHQNWNKGWRPWIPPVLCLCLWRDSEHPGPGCGTALPHPALLLGTSKHSSRDNWDSPSLRRTQIAFRADRNTFNAPTGEIGDVLHSEMGELY